MQALIGGNLTRKVNAALQITGVRCASTNCDAGGIAMWLRVRGMITVVTERHFDPIHLHLHSMGTAMGH